MSETVSGVAAGWFPDPTGRYELRYWNGSMWTEHVHHAGVAAIDDQRNHDPRAAQPDVSPPGPAHVLEFTYEPLDYVRFAFRGMVRKGSFWRWGAVFAGLAVLRVYPMLDQAPLDQVILAGVFAALLNAAIYFVLLSAYTVLAGLANNRAEFGPHKIEVDPNGVTEICPDSTVSLAWSGIHGVTLGRSHLAIWVRPTQAMVIPKRAAASSQQWDEFTHAVISGASA